MTKISLRGYNHEIEGLIERGHRLEEAVAHCRHILKTYPKNLESYRLLGKAYLEAKRYDQAVDIFQRVLVASPEDFVSHVGMSIIADDRGKLDDAIWHMERAFEVQPSNAAIQAEMQRLFGRRDGVEPPKIRLTRGALAHMYVQGELFTQAISEIQAVLGHDPNRIDMQVLLARAYFRNGQKAEAADVCGKLLAAAPFCLEANRLMAEIVGGTQGPEAAQDYRRRVFELEPYAKFAGQDLFATESVADAAVNLDRLEYTGPEQDTGSVPGIALGSMAQPTGASDSQPGWITRAADGSSGAPSPDESEDDVPVFMQEAGWKPVDISTPDAIVPQSEIVPAAVPGDLPAWVKALAPTDESDGAGAEQPEWTSADQRLGVATTLAPAPSTTEDQESTGGTGDWLQDSGKDSGTAEGTGFTPVRASEPAKTSQPAGQGIVGSAAEEPDDGLAWLESLAEKHGAKPEELLTDAESRSDEVPAWVSGVQGHGESTAEDRASRAMGDMPTEDPGSSAKATPYDWLEGLSDPDAFAAMEAGDDSDGEHMIGDGAAAAWPRQAPRPTVGEEPLWLGGEGVPTTTPPSETARGTSGEYESSTDLPAWLADLDKPEAVPADRKAPDSFPASLQVGPAGEPGTDAVAQPNDWRPAEFNGPLAVEGSTLEYSPEATGASSAPDSFGAAGDPESEAAGQRGAPLPLKTHPAEVPLRLGTPSLGGAQAELARGNIAAALDLYGKLIRKGKSLEDIIRHLRDALYRYPVEVPIWQSLGDAYMRANRLQEALDAYTKAEELLR